MAAPKGNDYNLKWTIEEANNFFNKVLDYVKENKKCRSLSEAVVELDEYEDVINYIIRKFPQEDFRAIKVARDIVKNRLASQGLDGDANPTMAIFLLKNNHGMTDRQQTDITTNGKEINDTLKVEIVKPDNESD